MTSAQGNEDWLRATASRLGFDVVRLTTAELAPQVGERLEHFVHLGRHADMTWLAAHTDRRRHPRGLWPQARSAIVVATSYAPPTDPRLALARTGNGVISVYAKGRDYHDVLKGRLKQLAGAFAARTRADVKVFVDTAPLMEKPLAAQAGVGWQGKHTNLVSREHGSWLFLAVILTTADLTPDAAEQDHCGSCRRCLDVCPTAAFPAPYQLDARRCIAYLTIEHKGAIPRELRAPLQNRVFGCDDCLAVCPWNKFAAATREARFSARLATDDPPLAELLALDDAAFRQRFAGTPVKRTGRDRFLRNVVIAAGNSGDPSLAPHIEQLLTDVAPLVRAMAVWSLARLVDVARWQALRQRYLPLENDPGVIEEWQQQDGDPDKP